VDKQVLLDKIAKEIERCKECKVNKSGLPVPGEGNPDADVMFVGMAPGRQEAKTGRPFVGPAGKLLTKLLDGIGVKREDVYITSPVKYFPEKILTKDDIKHGREHIMKQMEIIDPKIIVLMGSVAIAAILEDDEIKVVKDHGRVVAKEGKTYFITYHPAAILRFRKYLPELEADFKKLKKLI
jgi:DNA polymerase